MLLLTKNVPGPANCQVPHRNLKTGPQLGKVPDGGQPFFSLFCQDLIRLVHKVGVRDPVAPANPSPNLVELG